MPTTGCERERFGTLVQYLSIFEKAAENGIGRDAWLEFYRVYSLRF